MASYEEEEEEPAAELRLFHLPESQLAGVLGTGSKLRAAYLPEGCPSEQEGRIGIRDSDDSARLSLVRVGAEGYREADVPVLLTSDAEALHHLLAPSPSKASRQLRNAVLKGADVENSNLLVAEEELNGVAVGMGLQYVGDRPIEAAEIVVIGYGTVGSHLRHAALEDTSVLINPDEGSDYRVYLYNEGFVSKLAFANHSCNPNCQLTVALVRHRVAAKWMADGTLAPLAPLPCRWKKADLQACRSSDAGQTALPCPVDTEAEETLEVAVLLPALCSLRQIVPGEFISFDYGWSETERSPPVPCACGSPGCQGWLRRAWQAPG